MIGADGLGLISYHAGGDTIDRALRVAHCVDIACTSATISVVDSAGNAGEFSSITIGSDGLGLIAYRVENGGHELRAAHCIDLSCTSATISILDTHVGSLHTGITGISAATGSDGLVIIFYVRGSGARAAHCSNLDCSSASLPSPPRHVDAENGITIDIGADGLSIIAAGGSVFVQIIHCSDVLCGAWSSLNMVHSKGDAPAISIGQDGLPFVAFSSVAGTSRLAVLKCHDAACTDSTITDVGHPDKVFLKSSATGQDGLPIIAYYDELTRDLAVL